MLRTGHAILAASLWLGLMGAARAQSTGPASQPELEPLVITITGVEGTVRYRNSDQSPWTPVTVGLELQEGVEFFTCPKSAVRFSIPPNQVITLDRLGAAKVLRANIQDGKFVTDVGMKYGRVRYDVEAAERQYDVKLRCPSSTLAVRGTKVSLYDQPPFAPRAVSLRGRAEFGDLKRLTRFGGDRGTVTVQAGSTSAAALQLAEMTIDPTLPGARTAAEARLVQQVISQGAVVTYDPGSPVPIVRGGNPPSAAQVIADPPGALSFILRWANDTDLNMVVSPIGFNEIVAPVYPFNKSKTGGTTLYDHRGGSNGGLEVVFWRDDFPGKDRNPTVPYVKSIDYISGAATPYTLDTVVEGEVVEHLEGVITPGGQSTQPQSATGKRKRKK